MLDIEITPEKSISSEKWQIILGMSLYQVIQILKSNCETIKTIQLIYNDKVIFIIIEYNWVHRNQQSIQNAKCSSFNTFRIE